MGLGSFGISGLSGSDAWPAAVEADVSASEKSRLKAGCSQDWLPHKSEEICTNTKLLRGEGGVSLS
jgi:hypothetical protein